MGGKSPVWNDTLVRYVLDSMNIQFINKNKDLERQSLTRFEGKCRK